MRQGEERGAAALLVVLVSGFVVTGTALAVLVSAVLVTHRRVAAAADLSALAGAAAVQRQEAGCAAAAFVAGRNGATLDSCEVRGDVVAVEASRVARLLLGMEAAVSARARAGPVG